MRNESDNRNGKGRKPAGENHQDKIVAAWRDYLAAPEEGAEAFLRAIDVLIVTAVARHNRHRLDYSHCQDVTQEVRLELVPQRSLLDSAHLLELSAAAEKRGWTETDCELVWQKITNLVYMIARREVTNFIRAEERFQKRQHSWFLDVSGISHEATADEEGEREEDRRRAAALRQALHAYNYSEQESRLIESYCAGPLTQTELAQRLGLQQGTVSKRLRILRQFVLRVRRRDDEGVSPGL